MSNEAGHVQITEFSKEAIPQINWMMEDLFCQYGVSLPWFMLDFAFPDYSQRPDWCSGYNFNLDWGEWGYWLPWFNELLGFIFDEAHLPRWQMPDMSEWSWAMFNDYVSELYDNIQRHYVYGQSGTFTKDEVIEGEDSEVTGYYKWKDSDGYIHVANKSAADFEDEKIVGADSGAYAYTYEDFVFYETFSSVYTRRLRRDGVSEPDDGEDAAWDDYYSDPTYSTSTAWDYLALDTGSYFVNYPEDQRIIWYAYGAKLYYKFNTSGASSSPTSALLTLTCDVDVKGEATNPTITVYSQDFGDTVDSADWSNGTLVASQEVSDGDGQTIELSISTDYINVGGQTRFKISLAEIEAEGRLYEPDGLFISITDAELKLGYNE